MGGRRFDDDEIAFLREFAPIWRLQAIAADMGRSPGSIGKYCRDHDIPRCWLVKYDRAYTPNQIKRINRTFRSFCAACDRLGIQVVGGKADHHIPQLRAIRRTIKQHGWPGDWQPESIFATAEIGYECKHRVRPASRATSLQPGSWGKVEVLAARMAAGEELWHPEDFVVCDLGMENGC
jgi:hypothetical protein